MTTTPTDQTEPNACQDNGRGTAGLSTYDTRLACRGGTSGNRGLCLTPEMAVANDRQAVNQAVDCPDPRTSSTTSRSTAVA